MKSSMNSTQLHTAGRKAIPILFAVMTWFLLIPAVAQAAGEQNCSLHGSWIGYDQSGSAWWLSTASGMNGTRGSLILEVPLFDPTISGLFPDAVSGTDLRGVWTKTGGGTYDWTVLGYSYSSSLVTQYISKLSGRDTIEECDALFVSDVTLEIFAPDANPYEDAAWLTIPFPDHYGHRIKIELP